MVAKKLLSQPCPSHKVCSNCSSADQIKENTYQINYINIIPFETALSCINTIIPIVCLIPQPPAFHKKF
jgi:hypothetical protein